MKRIRVVLLMMIIVLASFSFSFADNGEYMDKSNTDQDIINQDTAVTIGMIFVTNLIKEMDWDENTQIDKVIPLHSFEGDISYYYIGLKKVEIKLYTWWCLRT